MRMFSIVLVMFLSVSCSSKAKKPSTPLPQNNIQSTDINAQIEFDAASFQLKNKKFSEAQRAFSNFLKLHPSDTLSVVAELYLLRSELGDLNNVSEITIGKLKSLASRDLDSRVKWAAISYQALALQNLEKKNIALEVLESYPSPSLSPLILNFDRSSIWVLIAESMRTHQRYTEALYVLDAISKTEKSILTRFAISRAFEMAPSVKEAALEAMTADKEHAFVRAIAGIVLLEKWLNDGGNRRQKSALSALLTRIENDLPGIDAVERGQRIREGIEILGPARQRIIGVILPIEGKNQKIGKMVLDAIQFGAQKVQGQGAGSVTIVIRNENKNAPEIMEEFERLGVALVIGPLDRKRAHVFAKEAQRLTIPMLSLSSSDFSNNPWAFRFSGNPKSEIKKVISISMAAGDQTFAVLSSQTPYSKKMASWFKAEVISRGGEVVLEKTFDRKDTDYTKLAGTVKKARPDAVFIPETGRVVGKISAFMAHVNVWGDSLKKRSDPKSSRIGVHYLGTSLWYQSSLVRQSSEYVKHALIPVWSSKLFDGEKSKVFYDTFSKSIGRKPSTFDVFSFDAIQIAYQLLAHSPDPEKIQALLSTLKYSGVSGNISGQPSLLSNDLRLLEVGYKNFVVYK